RDQVDYLRVGEAAGSTCRHARHDAWIEAVAVEGDDNPRSFRNMPESGFNALSVNLAGGHEAAAIVPCRFDFVEARPADATDADVQDAGDMWHLARPAHGVRIAKAFAIQLVAPVDMGVDLHDPDRPVIRKPGEKGNGHGIVAAEQDRYGRQ